MDQVLDMFPCRAPKVEAQPEGEELRITVSGSQHLAARLFSRLLNVPVRKTFMLDPHGARIWGLCDGKTTVREIVARLASEHGWSEERAKEAVLIYLSTLSQRKLMSFGAMNRESGRE